MRRTRCQWKAGLLGMAVAGAVVVFPVSGQTLATRGPIVYSILGMTPTGGQEITAIGAPPLPALPNAERPMALALDTQNSLWVVTHVGNIYRWGMGMDQSRPTRVAWVQQAGSASDISVGPDGSVYSVGFGASGDKPVLKWNGSTWLPISQAAGMRVVGNQCGLPEIVSTANQHLRINLTRPALWEPASKIAVREITMGSAGAFALGTTPIANKTGTLYPVMMWTSQILAAGAAPVWDWYETSLIASSIAINNETKNLWYADGRGMANSVAVSAIPLKGAKL